MNKKIVLLLTVLALSIAANVYFAKRSIESNKPGTAVQTDHHNHDHGETEAKGEEKELFTCPMHPEIIQENFGQCPICGMDLVSKDSKKDDDNPNIVSVDPVTVQNMGVRVDKVKELTIYRHIRSYGRVEIPDDNVSVVNLRFGGWIERIWVDKVGATVYRGQKLFSIYSPEVFTAQKEYLLALKNYGALHEITKSAKQKLKLWNVSNNLISKITEKGVPERLISIHSPASGYIKRKLVTKGSRVNKGKDLYQIYNLSSVWLLSEIYDFDMPWVKVGAKAKIKFTVPGKDEVEGTVSYIYPLLNTKSRTATVRIELNQQNVGKEEFSFLKPGMVATVIILSEVADKTVVPTESIIDTGSKKIVFKVKDKGTFEATDVKTGLVGDNDVTEITDGLGLGDKIVISGQFMLDSESQLKEAVQKFLHQKLHNHGSDTDKTLYTCPMHPTIIEEEEGSCPICGMDLTPKKDKGAGGKDE